MWTEESSSWEDFPKLSTDGSCWQAHTVPRGHQHLKKTYGVNFFSKANLAELTNYVIRHISIYSDFVISFLPEMVIFCICLAQMPCKPISLAPGQVSDTEGDTLQHTSSQLQTILYMGR